jgi:cytochrome c2
MRIGNLGVALSLWCAFAPLLLALDGGSAPAAADEGAKVYAAQRCMMCHSIEGKGNKKTPLDGVGDRLKSEEIRKWIVSPREMKPGTLMKPYPSLPPKDLEALVNYLAGLKKKQ